MAEFFAVAPEAFYRRYLPTEDLTSYRRCMSALVERLGLVGRSIVSLGSGTGTEEYFLLQQGNRLTMIDIDEQDSILPALRTMPPGDLHYIIGDATEVLADGFDVVYSSSLTPDELRRSRMLREPSVAERAKMILRHGSWSWPPWAPPFHPALMDWSRRLPTGGVLIIQSYCGGIDTRGNPHYLPACLKQLKSEDLTLQEVYRYKMTPGVMLYIASKGPIKLSGPPLTGFHARAVQEPVERIYPGP